MFFFILYIVRERYYFVTHTHFTAFYCDGSKGLYIHPNIWHEGVFPVSENQSFQGKQGKVHARVSIDLQKEFKKYIYFKTTL